MALHHLLTRGVQGVCLFCPRQQSNPFSLPNTLKNPKKAAEGALTQRIYDGLCQEITTGKLKPGELLSRRQIAQRYGASYTPVIEAMVRLENLGLVESEAA